MQHHPPSNSEHTTSLSKSKQRKSKDKKSSSSSKTTKSSSSTTSQTPASPRQLVSPSNVEQGQGFFDVEDHVPVKKMDSGYLPITGFGGTPAPSRMASNLGAILAQRGDNASGD